MVGWTSSSPKNSVQKTAYASSFDTASYQPVMGETFFSPISILVSAKEVKVPPPKIASHFRVRSAASDPAKGERPGNIYIYSGCPPPSLGHRCGR